MQRFPRNFAGSLALAAAGLLVACGGGGGGSTPPTPPAPTYSIGGNVTVPGGGPLAPGLVLQLSGAESLPVSTTGSFTFAAALPTATTYTVAVQTQPSTQNCVVTGGTGTVAAANVSNVAVSCALPTPRFAYVANLSNSQIEAFSVNPTTGSLTFAPSTALGGTATNYAVGVEPSGRFAYVVSNGSPGTVTAATINRSTGALTSLGAIAAGTTPQGLGIDPLGRSLYVTNFSGNGVTGFRINPSNGSLASLGIVSAGTNPVSVAIEPRGRFAYVANSSSGTVSQYSVASNGSLTFVASVNELTQPAPFAVEPLGRFGYTPRVQVNNVSAYTISTATGTLTSVGVPTPTGTSPSLVVFDPLGQYAFVINSPVGPAFGSISRYSIDAATGALTSLGAVTSTGVEAPVAASIDPSGKFLYVLHSGAGGLGGTIRVFLVDASGGVSSTLTGLNVTNSASSFAITR